MADAGGSGSGAGPSRREPTLGERVAGFAIAVLGIVLVAITPNPPVTLLHWVQVVGGASLSASLVAFGSWGIFQRLPSLPSILGWLRSGFYPIVASIGLTAVLAIGVPPAWDLVHGLSVQFLGCSPATQLRVVASPETVTTARRLASAYERWTAGEDHGCPAADVYVYAGTSEEIRARVGSDDGWSDESGALRDVGPRPDVWLAATSHEVTALGDAVAESTPIAVSPVVLAIPASIDPGRDRSGPWLELFAGLTDRGIGVVRADPRTTELGLLATALLYGQAGQDGRDGPPRLAPAEVERRIAQSLDAGGFPLTDTLGLLCRHRTLGSQAAVVASEQQVVRFNLGEPLGESCLSPAEQPQRLVALYPSDSRSLDHQFVRLSWSEPPQREAAARFGEWLRTDPGRDAIVATGMRPVGPYSVGAALTTGGIDPGALPAVDPIPPEMWDATSAAYAAAQRRGRVIFALDTSGSMAAAGPEGPRSLVAAGAVSAALQRMGPRDQFGIWLFPDAAGTGPLEALPVGPSDPARIAAAHQLLSGLQPAGNTPFFRTVIDAAATLEPDDPDQVDAVVVLTDGEDTSSGVGADAVTAALAGSGVRVVVVTIGEIRCSDPGLAVITTATAGECVDADPANLDTTLGTATAGLWGGR
ncbi:extracellular solute-binding protein [Pseudonocardia hierapolitana]|uniref:Extracellular solute-binding protein n=1 Tax=Pseudonocardia hierapolitana TaxID=1128676 RepID=A0A561T3P3_9PSEU|nr:VWA domain-containing protein [Pseudonocardia hierapolitana]TWF81727.1 extracellular solute-binding protein [Pseudonocardia hierapolitana]